MFVDNRAVDEKTGVFPREEVNGAGDESVRE